MIDYKQSHEAKYPPVPIHEDQGELVVEDEDGKLVVPSEIEEGQ